MTQDKAPATFDIDRFALPINPVESTALQEASNGSWERSNPAWPSARPVTSQSRRQPEAAREKDARRSQGPG